MLDHPALESHQRLSDSSSALLINGGAHLCSICPREDGLRHLLPGIDPCRSRDLDLGHQTTDEPREAQGLGEVTRMGEDFAPDELLTAEVYVDLIGAIEEGHRRCPCCTELVHEHGEVGMVAGELDDDRQALAHERGDDRDVELFGLSGIEVEIRLQTHDIDLQSICSSLTDTLGEVHPAPFGGTVDTSDDGDRELFLSLTDQLQIALDGFCTDIGGDVVLGLGVIILSDQMPRLHEYLLLEEGLQDDSTGACLDEGLGTLDVAGQARATEDDGTLQV